MKFTPTQTRCLLLASKISFCVFGGLHTSSGGGGWARSERQMLWKRCYPRRITIELPLGIALQFFGNTVKCPCSALHGVVRTHVINNYTLAVLSTLLYNNQACCCYYFYCPGPESHTSVWGYSSLVLSCWNANVSQFGEGLMRSSLSVQHAAVYSRFQQEGVYHTWDSLGRTAWGRRMMQERWRPEFPEKQRRSENNLLKKVHFTKEYLGGLVLLQVRRCTNLESCHVLTLSPWLSGACDTRQGAEKGQACLLNRAGNLRWHGKRVGEQLCYSHWALHSSSLPGKVAGFLLMICSVCHHEKLFAALLRLCLSSNRKKHSSAFL